jgi:hypothetical protein
MEKADHASQAIGRGEQAPGTRRCYERPDIIWTEPYQPMAFGASCVKQPGNSICRGGVRKA